MQHTQFPLAFALANHPEDLSPVSVEMMDLLQNTALVVATQRPLRREFAVVDYLSRKIASLTEGDPAWKAAKAILDKPNLNKAVRTFETYFVFYFGTLPYRGAKPLNAAVKNANNKLSDIYNN